VLALVRKAEEDDHRNLAAIVMMAALTGARSGELCALRWADVDLAVREITFRATVYDGGGKMVVKEGTKNHRQRTIALDEVGMRTLQEHGKVGMAEEAFVFSPSPRGKVPMRPGDVTHGFARLCKDLGLDGLLFHDLRHFSVSVQLDAGVPLPVVSAHHGRSSTHVTATIYSHAIGGRDLAAAEAVGRVLTVRERYA
jgi:integrase